MTAEPMQEDPRNARQQLIDYLNLSVSLTDASMIANALIQKPRIFLEALVEAGYQRDHIVRITEEGWSMIHSLQCRLEGLFDCPTSIAFEADAEPPVAPGDYLVSMEGESNTRVFKATTNQGE